MKFLYGTTTNYIDITEKVLDTFTTNGFVNIPASDDERAAIFGDPQPKRLKHILAIDDNGNKKVFGSNARLTVLVSDTFEAPSVITWWKTQGKDIQDPEERLKALQDHLKISYGDFKEELCEQRMAIRFIQPTNKILELGGNIGRNTLILASMLEDCHNLVTLESSPFIANQLQYNMDLNGIDSHIEASALSKRKLIQNGWDTIPSDILLPGYYSINSITYSELCDKYKIVFDTLVADCEGALYYILKDEPGLLDTINTILLENDFAELSHKEFVIGMFKEKGFNCVYNDTIKHYKVETSFSHSKDSFYEVWVRQ